MDQDDVEDDESTEDSTDGFRIQPSKKSTHMRTAEVKGVMWYRGRRDRLMRAPEDVRPIPR